MTPAEEVTIRLQDGEGASVRGLLQRPPGAWLLYVLAHGAGAGMRHRLMEAHAARFAARGIATLRYQFPYMDAGRRRPDRPALLHATVRAANDAAATLAPDLPRIAGGRSMGGRMTSGAAAEETLPGLLGIAFLAFPLHPPGKEGTTRATHLADVGLPLLFLNGTRDKLADLTLLEGVCGELPATTLEVLDGADHSFAVLKRSGRTEDDVHKQVTAALERFGRGLVGGASPEPEEAG